MSKMSELAAQIEELRRCGEVLIGISDSLKEIFSEEPEKAPKSKAKPKAAKKAAEPEAKPEEPAKEPEEEPKKEITLVEVRAVLTAKSRAGFTEEVKELLGKHGARKLSEVEPSEYEALMAEAEVLGNG